MKQKSQAGGRPPKQKFKLRPHDRGKLEKILREKSRHGAREYQRALMLILLSEGKGLTEVGEELGISLHTVKTRRNLYVKEGLERALNDAEGRGRKATILPEQEQKIIALACTDAPEGSSHWSIRLLAAEAKKQKILPSVSHTKVRIILERHELKPWREKNVVRQHNRR